MQPSEHPLPEDGARAEAMKDVLAAAALFGAGVFALVWIRSTEAPGGGAAAPGALDFASVPTLCSVILIALSAIYGAGAVVRFAGARGAVFGAGWRPGAVAWRRVATVAGLVAYVFALKALPFFVATAAFLAAMFVLYGHRAPVAVATVALAGSAVLTGLFVYALRLPI